MVVAVAVVGVVKVAGDYIVRVSGVRDRLMAAAGTMRMRASMLAAVVLGGAAVRISGGGGQLVVVHMIIVQVVQVALMQIVGVAFVFHTRVAASGAVRMSMPFVRLAIHDSSG